jgi:hypothetical protein
VITVEAVVKHCKKLTNYLLFNVFTTTFIKQLLQYSVHNIIKEYLTIRRFLDKLAVTQPVKTFRFCCAVPGFITVFTKARR